MYEMNQDHHGALIINEGWREGVELFCAGESFGNFLYDLIRRRFGIGRVANRASHHQIIRAGLNGPLGSDHPFLVVVGSRYLAIWRMPGTTVFRSLKSFRMDATSSPEQITPAHPALSAIPARVTARSFKVKYFTVAQLFVDGRRAPRYW